MNFMYKTYNLENIELATKLIFKLSSDTSELYLTNIRTNIKLTEFLNNFNPINKYFSTIVFNFTSITEFIEYYKQIADTKSKVKRTRGSFLSEFIYSVNPDIFNKQVTNKKILENLIIWINKTAEFTMEKLFDNNIDFSLIYLIFSDEYYPIIHILFSPVRSDGYKYKLPANPYSINNMYKELLLTL